MGRCTGRGWSRWPEAGVWCPAWAMVRTNGPFRRAYWPIVRTIAAFFAPPHPDPLPLAREREINFAGPHPDPLPLAREREKFPSPAGAAEGEVFLSRWRRRGRFPSLRYFGGADILALGSRSGRRRHSCARLVDHPRGLRVRGHERPARLQEHRRRRIRPRDRRSLLSVCCARAGPVTDRTGE